ncbi:MAG: DUF3368 domain-containing protein [Ilyomonas sp.]
MQRIIISDTSCLISLDKINQLHILKALFGIVVVTDILVEEFGKPLPDFIKIINPSPNVLHKISKMSIDKGEASAIALALENKDSLIIIDDYKARKIAEGLGLRITGTIGILIGAKTKGILASFKPVLTELSKTNFRLTDELIEKALKVAGK